jgi:PAS domain S-box-containing protein
MNDEALVRIFPGDSEMARRMRALDWSKTDLGDPSSWPENLRTAVSICLTSRFPIVLWWGPDLTLLYNDAYISILGPGKHPQWLGRSGRACWSDIWETIGPMLDGVMRDGRATWSEELLLFIERHLPREEAYFTFTYGPILTREKCSGIFCAVTETTDYVLSRRRLGTLRELGRRTADVHSAEAACKRAAEVLDENAYDVPFGALYLVDAAEHQARLAATVRAAEGFPAVIDLGDDAERPWPIRQVWTAREAVEFTLDPTHVQRSGGAWPEPPTRAVAVPVVAPGVEIGGVVVFGVNPRRVLDAGYWQFFQSVAGHIGTAVAEAHAYAAERKRAEALAELDRAKTTFFSNVSHEFRTPLTLMLGPLEDALHAPWLPDVGRPLLDVAHRNGLRLLRLVNTLLDFSRIEADRAEATFAEVDVCQLTIDLASVFRSAIERAGLEFEVRAERPTAPVFVDRDMWEKVVLNLLSNAFKFTFEGHILVSLTERDGWVLLAVEDTGTGIPAHELSHVFERFHRVRGAQGRTHEGTGIGLALVSELVKLHGGHVQVTSEVGRGSSFTVRIPTGSAHLPQDRVGGSRTPSRTALGAAPFVEEALRWLPGLEPELEPALDAGPLDTVTTAGAKVLVVDDNADMRAYLARLLRAYWEVEMAADGEEALRCIARRRPDLVLSDVMMPRLDGLQLTQAIRRDTALRTIPIILLSARAGEESRVEGVATGADDYLTKPFSARELVARVNANLEMARVRAEADRALRQRSAQFATLLNEAPAGVFLVDADFRIREVNPVARRTFGDMPDPTGRDFEEVTRILWEHDYADEIVRLFRHTLETGEPYSTPERGEKRRDRGVIEHYQWEIHRIALPDGRNGVVCYFRDIAEQVEARAQRERLLSMAERARTEAEAANAAKDNFLAVLSHELRSPMNAMLGWLRILKTTGTRDPALLGRAVETLERNIWIQAQVINDLLDVSRIMSGKLELERSRVDLASVVTGCVESFRPSAEGKRVMLRLDLEAEQVEVVGDGGRLQQVMSNLIGNAIKFTDPGGRITVTVARNEQDASVVVADTGQGIAPEFLPRLFERFTQGDSTTARKHGGLGLGLAIVKNLIALHGGEVGAESEGPGRGARFAVTLPVAEGRRPSPVVAVPTQDGPLPPLDVLIVEDDADSLRALEVALEEGGARVRTANSVRQALEVYSARPPDLVISDIGMPGQDGYVLIRAIRAREEGRSHHTLAIAMTGFAARQDREMALRAGFDEHVGKPVELDALLERVRVLEASRRRRPPDKHVASGAG